VNFREFLELDFFTNVFVSSVVCRALHRASRAAAAAAEIWDRRAERCRRRQFMVAAGVSRRRL